ncbi:MAG: hypothetical protein II842_19130 [Butyrivibrio sp.]|nr:hypothetical protein [Butyrivibrio sp.]
MQDKRRQEQEYVEKEYSHKYFSGLAGKIGHEVSNNCSRNIIKSSILQDCVEKAVVYEGVKYAVKGKDINGQHKRNETTEKDPEVIVVIQEQVGRKNDKKDSQSKKEHSRNERQPGMGQYIRQDIRSFPKIYVIEAGESGTVTTNQLQSQSPAGIRGSQGKIMMLLWDTVVVFTEILSEFVDKLIVQININQSVSSIETKAWIIKPYILKDMGQSDYFKIFDGANIFSRNIKVFGRLSIAYQCPSVV